MVIITRLKLFVIFNLQFFVVEQIITYIEKMNIKESSFRALEAEFSDAQKYIDKLNQEKNTLKKKKEK